MTDTSHRVPRDGIELASLFRFPAILQSVTQAMQVARLLIALFMVMALITVGNIWDAMTPATVPSTGLADAPISDSARQAVDRDVAAAVATLGTYAGVVDGELADTSGTEPDDVRDLVVSEYRSFRRQNPGDEIDDAVYLTALQRIESLRPRGAFEATVDTVSAGFVGVVRGIVDFELAQVRWGAASLFIELPRDLWRAERGFTIFYGLVFLLVMTFGGGALSRMAACQWARRERITMREGIDFAIKNWWQLLCAPIMPLLLAGVVAVILVILSLLMWMPVVEVLGALVYGAALLLGAAIAFLLLGYFAGLFMMIPAVACECCDAPDAQQRAYSFVIGRPAHLLGYTAVALVGLALGYVVVSFFAAMTLNATSALYSTSGHVAVEAAGGFEVFDLTPERLPPVLATVTEIWSHGFISFWQSIVLALVPSWVIVYFFAASTKVYLLMRRVNDGQDEEHIWRPGLVPGTLAPEPEPLEEPGSRPGETEAK